MGQSLKLSEARAKTPPLSSTEIQQCTARLQAAVFDAISEADVQVMVKSLVERAKDGDVAAVKMVFGLIGKASRIGD
jgi:hypothetical protein